MSCRTLFHELIELVKKHVPEEKKFEFYKEILITTHSHGISLHTLLGEDDEFDRAYRNFMEVS
jgi:hypothetical protein